jgi:Na+/proline symporter
MATNMLLVVIAAGVYVLGGLATAICVAIIAAQEDNETSGTNAIVIFFLWPLALIGILAVLGFLLIRRLFTGSYRGRTR